MRGAEKEIVGRERDEFLRAAWRLLVAGQVDAERLVFVEERWVPTFRFRRCRAGRARGSVQQRSEELGQERDATGKHHPPGLGPCLAVEGSTTREVFETYLERVLAPTLKPAQVVVMDNLSAHKGGRVKEIIECRGCELLHLPPYSPDFNPIEQTFSKLKGLLRRAEARTRESLVEAMGQALSAVSASDARGFFGYCGYSAMDQLL